MSTTPRSIACPNCSALLQRRGGHRVATMVCGRCGKVLDPHDNFKVLTSVTNMASPESTLHLGMKGTIKGVEFTVIGVVQYRAQPDRWLEYQLFSPTHGYVWLEIENGHFVFNREVMDLPNPASNVLRRTGSTFTAKGMTFRMFDTYLADIVYMEGEFSCMLRANDEYYFMDGIRPPYIYSIELQENTQEYSFGEYIEPEEITRAFALTPPPPPRKGIHAAQPFKPSPTLLGLKQSGWIFSILSLLILLSLSFFLHPSNVLDKSYQISEWRYGTDGDTFTVTKPNYLLEMKLYSPLDNAWALYNFVIENEKGEEVYNLTKEIAYYHGVQDGESWHKGSPYAQAYFKVPAAGNYTFRVIGETEQETSSAAMQEKQLHITLREGFISSWYFTALFMMSLFALAIFYFFRLHTEAQRWQWLRRDTETTNWRSHPTGTLNTW